MSGFGAGPIPRPLGAAGLSPDNAALRRLGAAPESVAFPLAAARMQVGRNDPPRITVDIDLGPIDRAGPRTISRLHAELQWVEGNLELRDMSSRNGTFVNGERLSPTGPRQASEPRVLKEGDRVRFGGHEFEVVRQAVEE